MQKKLLFLPLIACLLLLCSLNINQGKIYPDGDIIKMYNDRGSVLGIAQITERVRPGVLHSYESSGIYDPLEPGKAYSPDRGGCVNLITPSRMLSKNAPGMAPNSCLVEITKWEV